MDDPDTGRRIIVTHQRPHLDEVVAIWLLRKFDPAFKDCNYQFLPYFGQVPPGDHITTVGFGGGKYDEHKLSHHISAAHLVYDDLLTRGLVKSDDQALIEIVKYTDRVDRGQTLVEDNDGWAYTPSSIIRSHIERTGDDADAVRFGLELIDNCVTELRAQAAFQADWAKRIEFNTPWGKGAGVVSDYMFSDSYAYAHGFPVRIQCHRSDPISSIKIDPSVDADLTPVYDKAVALEPDSWYIHQMKKMVISNVNPSTGRTPTKLTLQQLIDLVKA
jgi:hypothetical protein